MHARISALIVSTCVLASMASAQAPDNKFPLLDGKANPLTLKLKDLDPTWRVFSTSSSSYTELITSAMLGNSGNRVFTKGETVTIGTDLFLITYKADAPNLSSLMGGGGGMPKPVPLTADTVLRLSLMNIHAVTTMDGIRAFDLKEQTAAPEIPALSAPTTPAGAAAAAAAPAADDNEKPPLANGTKAPDFTVHDAKGNPVKLSAYRGKVVVLDFWSTWCGPCQQSLPHTNTVAAKYAGKKVVVLGVNVWDTKKAFLAWLPEHKQLSSIKFAIDTSPSHKDVATRLYNVTGIPTQFVIDGKGKIVKSFVGSDDDTTPLETAIKLALARK